MTSITFPLTVTAIKDIAPDVRQVSFQPLHQAPLAYIPGQFISIHFTIKDKLFKRSYSIASLPSESVISVALSYFKGGVGSEYLFSLKPDHTVIASGPYGRLVLQETIPQRYVFLATGTGVTPFRSMLPALTQRLKENPHLAIDLIFGCRDLNYAIYQEDFLNLAAIQPRFKVHFYYSRVKDTAELKPYEHLGYVQAALPSLQLDPTQTIVYLCGNPNMIDEAFAWLKEHDFQSSQVKREKYIS